MQIINIVTVGIVINPKNLGLSKIEIFQFPSFQKSRGIENLFICSNN